MGKYFGTDGVRGLANKELSIELACSLGKAGAQAFAKELKHPPRILIANDSRISADMLEAAITAGMCSVGAKALIAGTIPTPAAAFLVKQYGLDAGVVISASHNPFYDNGIKFFSRDGIKLSDALEAEIEELIDGAAFEQKICAEIGIKEYAEDALEDYVRHLLSTMGGVRLDGLRIALDCANGATSKAAPMAFYELGAEVFVISNEPDGVNINDGCGSTHIDNLKRFVKECGADIGFAFDGDGDRLICVDENVNEVDGDMVLTILAKSLKAEGRLKNNTVVATVMSNLGFFLACDKEKINTESTAVGDRYVLERMLEGGFNLGGEQSGHVIFLDYGTTGDGILTALQLARIAKLSGKSFSALNTVMLKLPQVLVNARVPNDKKKDYLTNADIVGRINALEAKYAGFGRVLIRPSGTEPLVRVTIEGNNLDEITNDANGLAEFIEACYAE